MIAKIRDADFVTIQLYESTDISGKAQLLVFRRFVSNGDNLDKFLFCKPLPEKIKKAKAFLMLSTDT